MPLTTSRRRRHNYRGLLAPLVTLLNSGRISVCYFESGRVDQQSIYRVNFSSVMARLPARNILHQSDTKAQQHFSRYSRTFFSRERGITTTLQQRCIFREQRSVRKHPRTTMGETRHVAEGPPRPALPLPALFLSLISRLPMGLGSPFLLSGNDSCCRESRPFPGKAPTPLWLHTIPRGVASSPGVSCVLPQNGLKMFQGYEEQKPRSKHG